MEETLQNLKIKFFEALIQAKDAFLRTLWNLIKEEVIASANQSLELLTGIIKSDLGKEKKELILDIIMSKLALPVFLKPFKGLIRKFLSNKIEEAVNALINKGHELIG